MKRRLPEAGRRTALRKSAHDGRSDRPENLAGLREHGQAARRGRVDRGIGASRMRLDQENARTSACLSSVHKAVGPQTLRVSDAARRRKVFDARTAGCTD